MKTAFVITAAFLFPVLALAQVGTYGAVGAQVGVGAPGVRAGASASTTVSATATATAKSRADKEIDRRIAALNELVTRVSAMTRVTDQFKGGLSGNVQGQISSLTTLKAKIDADTDTEVLKTDIKSIADSYRIYRLVLPQSRIAAAADRVVNIATMESALGAKLKARIDAAAAAGAETGALNAALTDLASSTASAVASAQAAVTASASLTPDQGDKTVQASNTATLQAAHKDLQAAQQALVQGRKDITTIVQGLHTSASANASSSAQTQ